MEETPTLSDSLIKHIFTFLDDKHAIVLAKLSKERTYLRNINFYREARRRLSKHITSHWLKDKDRRVENKLSVPFVRHYCAYPLKNKSIGHFVEYSQGVGHFVERYCTQQIYGPGCMRHYVWCGGRVEEDYIRQMIYKIQMKYKEE